MQKSMQLADTDTKALTAKQQAAKRQAQAQLESAQSQLRAVEEHMDTVQQVRRTIGGLRGLNSFCPYVLSDHEKPHCPSDASEARVAKDQRGYAMCSPERSCTICKAVQPQSELMTFVSVALVFEVRTSISFYR